LIHVTVKNKDLVRRKTLWDVAFLNDLLKWDIINFKEEGWDKKKKKIKGPYRGTRALITTPLITS
jgi:hypothetical protein